MNIREHVPLADYTTLHVGGEARYFVTVATIDELKDVIKFANGTSVPLIVLGEGANVLISDRGFAGLVVQLALKDISFNQDKGGTADVRAGAGAVWDEVVRKSVERRLGGLESTSGIPGSVGAAVVGNIAAYGQAVSDTLKSVEVLDAHTVGGDVEHIDVSDLGLKYRYSDFQNNKLASKIILHATFVLRPFVSSSLEYESALKVARELNLNVDNIVELRKVILEARRRAGSLLEEDSAVGAKTAGSFFRNPEVSMELAREILAHEEFGVSVEDILKQNRIHGGSSARISAAHILLAAGFKRGQRWGNVRLHPQHILKIENMGAATAQDIFDVSKEIISTVNNKFGIQLEPEVRFIGF